MSPKNRFSLPVVLVFLLVLLFLAGAPGTLHHKNHHDHLSASRASKVFGAISRKLLRQQEPKKQPSGGEALPRGIIHGTFNLEMVSMVGDPEEQRGNFPNVCVHGRARSGTADAGLRASRRPDRAHPRGAGAAASVYSAGAPTAPAPRLWAGAAPAKGGGGDGHRALHQRCARTAFHRTGGGRAR
jgi:hypothetical protein